MPAYNAECFINEAIKSIQEQTYSQWELLIVDDGSSDATAAIAECLASEDPRIRVMRQAPSGHAAVARNRALDVMRGDYVAFLDADDVSSPQRLSTCVTLLDDNSDTGYVFHNMWLMNENGVRRADSYLGAVHFLQTAATYLHALDDKHYLLHPSYLEFMCLHYCAILSSSVMVRRSWFDTTGARFPVDLVAGEDIDVWFRMASDLRGQYVDSCLGGYRKYEGSTTTHTETYLKDTIEAHRRNYARFHQRLGFEPCREYRYKISRHRGYLAYHYAECGRWRDALSHYFLGLMLERDPSQILPLVKCLVRAVLGKRPSVIRQVDEQ